MRLLLSVAALAPLAAFGGCATLTPASAPTVPRTAPVEAVIDQIKLELAQYNAAEAAARAGAGAAAERACGGGDIDLSVSSVTVQLSALQETRADASLGIGFPVGPAAIGPSFSAGSERSASQTLTLTLYPLSQDGDGARPAGAQVWAGAPIRDALLGLRASLTRVADAKPCFSLSPKGGPPAGETSVAFGFSVRQSRAAGGQLELLTTRLGAETAAANEAANTIIVRFGADGPGGVFTTATAATPR